MENSKYMANALNLLEGVRRRQLSCEERRELAVELAGIILLEAKRIQTSREKETQGQLARMMHDPLGKAFITNLTDQCFRTKSSSRAADQILYLIDQLGIPSFLTYSKKLLLTLFYYFGKWLANPTIPLMRTQLRREMAAVILPGEQHEFSKHLRQRHQEKVRINLNHLGEAILGEAEAKKRLKVYLEDLTNPEIEYISIKISTICSQINLLGWEETLDILSERLKSLYRVAKTHFFVLPNGQKVPKFVNLDMEEYRDLHLTVELFRRVLDDAEFYHIPAGIVLQSYLPDAFLIQQNLTAWAMNRVTNGGAPIKIRLVKGANLAMEQVEASLREWPQAPYTSKCEVDANYKRMVDYGSDLERAKAVRLGIASHNLFDIAYALLLRTEKSLDKYIGFEMLEGMADPIRRVVQALASDMLLYCPVATKEEFQNAIAYLIRRLDENTAPENFLRYAFDMVPGTQEWKNQVDLFTQACQAKNVVGNAPRRKQNRFNIPKKPNYNAPFHNEPDSDWSLPQNRKWAETIIREHSKKHFDSIPLVLGSSTIPSELTLEKGEDPSFPEKELYNYALAEEEQLELALQTAVRSHKKWSLKPLRERLLLLDEVAHKLRGSRGALIGAMVADTAKTIYEADIEVSEAIDFAVYYRHCVEEFHFLPDITWKSKGPILVTPPWNFPCSIPASGILAALAAGNSVIFKPAPEAVLVGWTLANIFWGAGIDRDVLQFFCCKDDPIGSRLVQDSRIAAVILTGATSTAKEFMRLRPGIDLSAETGGKNAMIVTRMADRDLAVKDIIQSAFGHAGQKCSACSLVILEKELYEDNRFREQLRDAAASLKVGTPWDLSTRLNPLIRAPNPTLLRGLTTLEEGEEWLLEPKQDPANPQLWSPGIKIGVKKGSFTHQTELFGPVLGIMYAHNLEEAIELANGTPYGLTSGIHTLDEREQAFWIQRIEAGNCYINRGITGAVVRRQPFGGCKASSFGKGAKAGGPNYVTQFMSAAQKSLPREREEVWNEKVSLFDQEILKDSWSEEQREWWQASLASYTFFWENYFSKYLDPNHILGQDNFLRYVPHEHQVLRVKNASEIFDTLRVIAAALVCHAPLEISLSTEDKEWIPNGQWLTSQQKIVFTVETEQQCVDRIYSGNIKRLRVFSTPSDLLLNASAEAGCPLIIEKVLANGRLELLSLLREVSLSIDYHRYGFLGTREIEKTCGKSTKIGCGAKCSCNG